MDYALLTIAVACWLLGGVRRPFLQLVAAEFAVCTALVACQGALPADYWFLVFAVINCGFSWAVLRLGHRLSREYSATLVVSAAWAVLVFVGYVVAWRSPYDLRPGVMTAVCAYQLWLAANEAGAVRGTITGAARGFITAFPRRRRRAAAGHTPVDLDDSV